MSLKVITAEDIMRSCGVNRSTAIPIMKMIAKRGVAVFVKGVKGYSSRLESHST